uniref:Ovule protein n=1 Tax=Heterorhabditis bacteriophora TaxID=37862 RepID=A0A1I7WQW7_HETBA
MQINMLFGMGSNTRRTFCGKLLQTSTVVILVHDNTRSHVRNNAFEMQLRCENRSMILLKNILMIELK